jgi:DsbC/DsbD-like thiol-disulfide interchange protein
MVCCVISTSYHHSAQMKKLIFLVLLISMSKVASSQTIHPDKWTFSSNYSSKGEAELLFKLKLDKDWHVYSQNTPDGGPLSMLYKFEPSACYELIGKCIEPTPKEEYDSSFMMKVLIFDKEVTFHQKVKLKNSACTVKGTIEYQICKQACISKDTSFVFNLDLKKKN